jgi:hypothetical protein
VVHNPPANPDLENAAKEAVNGVENVAKVLLDDSSGSLGDCVKELRTRRSIPREMARILESLYAYRNSSAGVGHGGTCLPAVSPADANFVLGIASVAIIHLDSISPTVRRAISANDAWRQAGIDRRSSAIMAELAVNPIYFRQEWFVDELHGLAGEFAVDGIGGEPDVRLELRHRAREDMEARPGPRFVATLVMLCAAPRKALHALAVLEEKRRSPEWAARGREPDLFVELRAVDPPHGLQL